MEEIKTLIDRLIAGDFTPEELDQLLANIDNHPHHELLEVYLLEQINAPIPDSEVYQQYESLLKRLDAKVTTIPFKTIENVKLRSFSVWKWAVAILFFLVFSFLLYRQNWFVSIGHNSRYIQEINLYSQIVLDNNRVVKLNEIHAGDSVTFKGLTLHKSAEGVLRYKISQENIASNDFPLSLATGIGDSYQIVLPDGTNAWLNAQSKISFPANFKGDTRTVETEGEVYFEVTPARLAMNKPFVVSSKQQKIIVLGTSFNVKCYPGQSIVTSLFEGRIKLELNDKIVFLKPGDQAIFDDVSSKVQIGSFDQSNVLDWKAGYFVFDNASLHEVLEKLGTWYGLQTDKIEALSIDPRISARIKRDMDVNIVLKSVEKVSNYHFYIDSQKNIRLRNH